MTTTKRANSCVVCVDNLEEVTWIFATELLSTESRNKKVNRVRTVARLIFCKTTWPLLIGFRFRLAQCTLWLIQLNELQEVSSFISARANLRPTSTDLSRHLDITEGVETSTSGITFKTKTCSGPIALFNWYAAVSSQRPNFHLPWKSPYFSKLISYSAGEFMTIAIISIKKFILRYLFKGKDYIWLCGNFGLWLSLI